MKIETITIPEEILDDVESWCEQEDMDLFETGITIGDDGTYSTIEVMGTDEQMTIFMLRWS